MQEKRDLSANVDRWKNCLQPISIQIKTPKERTAFPQEDISFNSASDSQLLSIAEGKNTKHKRNFVSFFKKNAFRNVKVSNLLPGPSLRGNLAGPSGSRGLAGGWTKEASREQRVWTAPPPPVLPAMIPRSSLPAGSHLTVEQGTILFWERPRSCNPPPTGLKKGFPGGNWLTVRSRRPAVLGRGPASSPTDGGRGGN